MSNLRRQGIYAISQPTIKSQTVTAANFSVGYLIGQFERKFAKAFPVNNPTEFATIFGSNVSSSWYGNDSVKGFFDNIVPASALLYVKSHVGNTGSAIDAVQSSATIVDTAVSPLSTLKLAAAYQNEVEYGVSGNRTGYTITNGARFTTALVGATGSSDAFFVVASVSGIRIGDLVKIAHSSPVYVKVTGIDESTRKVSFTGTVGAVVPDTTAVTVMGLHIRTWRKAISGLVTEVNSDLGSIFCTMEPEVSEFYVNNVFSTNTFMSATDLSSASALNLSWPADVATVTYLASGADGTAASTAAHWAFGNLSAANSLPVRFVANCETTDATVQAALETYCKAREDMPKVIYNIAENRTKAQLTVIGQSFQRSDDVLGIIPGHWITVKDPFSNSSLSPDRHIPSVGHIMGLWIRSLNVNGIHYVPAVNSLPVNGITGVVGDQFLDDLDRTDLCNAGINCIQFISGSGFVLRSAYTPSTTTEFKFANGIFMRDFFKVSILDSLANTQNEPNNFDRIKTSADAIRAFMFTMWTRGSTGSVPTGETFGQSLQDDGITPTSFDDHIVIQADLHNNPQSQINVGNRNLDLYFTYPTPAGSIQIGVGLILR